MWRVDLHLHSDYSKDSRTTLDGIVTACRKKKLDAIALTDHNSIEGALRIKKLVPKSLEIIVGEEVGTKQGEVIGLFLTETVKPGLSVVDTIESIREQGGIVVIPHPFDVFRKSCIDKRVLLEVAELIGGIEVFNSRNLSKNANEQAEEFAKKHDLIRTAGSDAHLAREIGNSYMEMLPFNSAATFIESARKAKISGKKSGVIPHVLTKIIKISGSLK